MKISLQREEIRAVATSKIKIELKNPELDLSIFALNDSRNLCTDGFIFYNNPNFRELAFRITKLENSIEIYLGTNVFSVYNLEIVASTRDPQKNFSMFPDAQIRIIEPEIDREILNEKIVEDCNSMIVAEIFKYQSDLWRIKSIAKKFNGGLAEVCKFFGVEVID